jgi:hypothetical protein
MTSPMKSSGVTTSTAIIGSSRIGAGLAETLLDRHRTSDLERHFGRVDLVIAAVDQLNLDVNDGISGEYAGSKRLLNALVDRRNVLLGNRAADDLVVELVASSGSCGRR